MVNDKTKPPPGGKGTGGECDQDISRWKGKLRVKINLSGGRREVLSLQLALD